MFKINVFKGELVKNFSKHFSGTVIGAIISFALTPVFTRMFSPEEFGLFYLYLSIVNSLPTLMTGRYDQALMLPKSDNEAASIFVGSLLISFTLCLLLFWFSFLFGDQIGQLLNNSDIVFWFPFCVVVIFMVSFNLLVSFWLVRKKAFLGSAKNKVVQSTSVSAWTFGAGSNSYSNGLIVGDLMGKVTLFFFGFYQLWKTEFKGVKLSLMVKGLKKYRDFPIYNAIPSLLDKFSLNMPVMIISSFYNVAINGFINLPRQILGTPLALISASLSQVYFQNIVEKKNDNKLIVPQLLKAIKVLSGIAIIFLVVVLLCSEEVFAFVFGEEWRVAGTYAKILSFAIAIKFVVSPLSVVFPSLNKMKVGSFWQVLYFISICILFFLESFQVIHFLIIYVVIELIMYSYYLYLIIRTSKQHDLKIK
jgi:O-antigen/teichoic acid export membrane protein